MNISDIKPGQRLSASEFRKLKGKGKVRTPKEESRKEKNPKASKKRPSKFNAKVTWVDNIRFDSAWEAQRYSLLKILEKSGLISDLQLQVPFEIRINDVKVTDYIADFVYKQKGKTIVEDAKGYITPEYRIKRNLMLAVHNIKILETRQKSSR